MRIAMANALLPNDEKAGVPFQVHHLANELAARGHEVTVFSFSSRPVGALYSVCSYPRVPALRRFYPFLFAYQLATTNFSAFDVLHVHGDNYLLWNTHPQVRTFHGSAADEARAARTLRRKAFFHVTHLLERLSVKIADRNVGVSETTRQRFAALHSVVPCGVDTNSFTPGAKSANPTILFVGTTGGRKRGRFLAEVFGREVRSHIPNAELLMVSDGNICADGVQNLGRVSDSELAALYRSAWLFCLPSSYEGFGVPYIEAMASGTAVVASPNPGALEVLKDGEFGIVSSDESLGLTLRALLSDETQREEFVRRGLLRSADYRWGRIAAQYENVYRSAISDSPETRHSSTGDYKSACRRTTP
jgi:phosphatidylinositol alpha-mannosyltransferase